MEGGIGVACVYYLSFCQHRHIDSDGVIEGKLAWRAGYVGVVDQ